MVHPVASTSPGRLSFVSVTWYWVMKELMLASPGNESKLTGIFSGLEVCLIFLSSTTTTNWGIIWMK